MYNLKEHNVPVFQEMESNLLQDKKAIVITGTGTGKSYLTLAFIEKYNLKALVVLPYNSLKSQWEKLNPNKIETCTYIYFSRHVDDVVSSDYDIVVFDEAQHCGAKTWQPAIEKFMSITNQYVLGLSADAKRYSDAGKDMAQYFWGNNIVYGYDLGEAVHKGILPPITYVSSLYDTSGYEDILQNTKVSKILLGKLNTYLQNVHSVETILKKHMPMARKTVVFVDTVKRFNVFMDMISNTYPNVPIYVVHSKQSLSENQKALDAFEDADCAFIFSINMLNEGLHVKGADACIMFRLTESPTIFFQQIGRALSSGGHSSLVFDFVSNRHRLQIQNIPYITRCNLFQKSDIECKESEQIIVKDYIEDLYVILDDIYKSLDDAWSMDEIAILEQYYPDEGTMVYLRLPGRSKTACGQKAASLNISYIKKDFWNAEMIQYVKEKYCILGPKTIALNLNISVSEVKKMAQKLGVTNSERVKEWTDDLKAELLLKYEQYGKDCFTMMDGFSKDAVRKQLKRLGINYANKFWTQKEVDILLSNSDKAFSELSELIGRSRQAVRKKYYEMELHKV